jgi:hypothetical protein
MRKLNYFGDIFNHLSLETRSGEVEVQIDVDQRYP